MEGLPRPAKSEERFGQFYVVRADQLVRVRRSQHLSYVGTQEGLHFFRAWNKLVKPGEVDRVAVYLRECEVTNPRRIDDEVALRRYRPVELAEGRCVVR